MRTKKHVARAHHRSAGHANELRQIPSWYPRSEAWTRRESNPHLRTGEARHVAVTPRTHPLTAGRHSGQWKCSRFAGNTTAFISNKSRMKYARGPSRIRSPSETSEMSVSAGASTVQACLSSASTRARHFRVQRRGLNHSRSMRAAQRTALPSSAIRIRSKRMGRDSNPRYGSTPHTRFPIVLLKPTRTPIQASMTAPSGGEGGI